MLVYCLPIVDLLLIYRSALCPLMPHCSAIDMVVDAMIVVCLENNCTAFVTFPKQLDARAPVMVFVRADRSLNDLRIHLSKHTSAYHRHGSLR